MKKRNARRGYRDFMRIVYKKKGGESKRQGIGVYFFIRDKSAKMNFNYRGHRVHRGKKQKDKKPVFSVISPVQFSSTLWCFYEIHELKKANALSKRRRLFFPILFCRLVR
jgi:hypothetical protein